MGVNGVRYGRRVVLVVEEFETDGAGFDVGRRQEITILADRDSNKEKVHKFQKFVERVRRTIGVNAAA